MKYTIPNLVLFFSSVFITISCIENKKTVINKNDMPTLIENKQSDDCFQKINLPFVSNDIDYKYDSLGYAILGNNDFCISEKLKGYFGENRRIYPVGIINSKKYNLYILGHDNVGEENLEPIIYGYTFSNDGKKIDSLELQLKQLWDYSRKKTFAISPKMEFSVSDSLILTDLSDSSGEKIESKIVTKKFLIDENGKFSEVKK